MSQPNGTITTVSVAIAKLPTWACYKIDKNTCHVKNTTIWISLNAMIIAFQYFYESKTNFQLDANRCTSMGLWLKEKAMGYPSMVDLYCFMKAFMVERYKSATSCYPFRFPSHFSVSAPICHTEIMKQRIHFVHAAILEFVELISHSKGRRVETSMGIRWHFWSLFRILAWQIT